MFRGYLTNTASIVSKLVSNEVKTYKRGTLTAFASTPDPFYHAFKRPMVVLPK